MKPKIVTNTPRSIGQKFSQYLFFCNEVENGREVIIISPKYVVISAKRWEEIQEDLQRPKLFEDDLAEPEKLFIPKPKHQDL